MRRAAVVAAALVTLGCSGGDAAEPVNPSTTATPATVNGGIEVVAVIDGDTLDVRLPGGEVERVRVIGVNAPERDECHSAQATATMASLLDVGPIELVADRSDRDRFGRLLRYVEVDGEDVGVALVETGAAVVRVSEPDTAREPALRAAQDRAQAGGVGLWAPDACGAPAATGVRISDLRLDAAGDDAANLNDEWVELANDGTVPAGLGGWTIRDESATHRFAIPDGFTLAPGARVRIRSGCGPDTATDLHWCVSGSAVWNNDGDTAFLLDPSGNVIDDLYRVG